MILCFRVSIDCSLTTLSILNSLLKLLYFTVLLGTVILPLVSRLQHNYPGGKSTLDLLSISLDDLLYLRVCLENSNHLSIPQLAQNIYMHHASDLPDSQCAFTIGSYSCADWLALYLYSGTNTPCLKKNFWTLVYPSSRGNSHCKKQTSESNLQLKPELNVKLSK